MGPLANVAKDYRGRGRSTKGDKIVYNIIGPVTNLRKDYPARMRSSKGDTIVYNIIGRWANAFRSFRHTSAAQDDADPIAVESR
jgi:hypothetical protein